MEKGISPVAVLDSSIELADAPKLRLFDLMV